MKYERFVWGNIVKKQTTYVLLFGLALTGCATTDARYADRNNIDAARSRCVELARSMGYRDVGVDSIDRDGGAEWKVRLVVRKEGKDRKERCEYNARTDRVHMDD
jgi:hypothetical protein